MKTIFLFICFGLIILTLGHTRAEPGRTKQPNIAFSGFDTLHFTTAIQPVLQKNCSPCHFPGGKMYSPMPFDKGETIIRHQAGILRRFSDKKENELVKQFIEKSNQH